MPNSLIPENMSWSTIKCIGQPRGRHETAFVEVEGIFYLIGGREAEGAIERFNPETFEWDCMEATSPLIHHFQPVVLNNEIWMVGAMTDDYPTEPPFARIQIYSPKTDSWRDGPIIPEQRRRGSAGTVVHNNNIFVVGGITFGHTHGTNGWFDMFNPETCAWEVLPDAPHIRDHFHAVVLNNKLYCIGGRNTSHHQEDNFEAFFGAVILEIDVWDFATQCWTTLPGKANLPEGSAAGGVATLAERIIYFGGETEKEALNKCWSFDPETMTWTQIASLMQGRHGSQAITYNNNVFIAAGSPVRGGGNIESVEVLG